MPESRRQLRVVIVDDQASFRHYLQARVKAAGYDLVAEAESAAVARVVLTEHRPDVVFLDVRLGDGDGVDLALECLPWFRGLVFTTGAAEHAARAFDLGAIDYLVKPFDDNRFSLTIGRIARHFKPPAASGPLPAAPLPSSPRTSRLLVRHEGELLVLKTQTVDWFEAYGDCVKIHIGERVLVDRLPLTTLEQQLDPRFFVRVHRSAIVNLDRVRTIRPGRFGDGTVVLSTGDEVAMSRSYKAKLLDRC